MSERRNRLSNSKVCNESVWPDSSRVKSAKQRLSDGSVENIPNALGPSTLHVIAKGWLRLSSKMAIHKVVDQIPVNVLC